MNPLRLIRGTSTARPAILSRTCNKLPASSLSSQQFPLSQRQFTSTSTANMPTYIVTLKDDASDEQVAATKQQAKDNGGKITHEYSLIKAFAVDYPEDQISTLENHEHVKAVEKDQEVRTQ